MEFNNNLLITFIADGYLEGVKYLIDVVNVPLFTQETCMLKQSMYCDCADQYESVSLSLSLISYHCLILTHTLTLFVSFIGIYA